MHNQHCSYLSEHTHRRLDLLSSSAAYTDCSTVYAPNTDGKQSSLSYQSKKTTHKGRICAECSFNSPW